VTGTILTYLSQAIVYVVMNVLAEMVTFLPMSGITVPYFVGRFVDRSLAFATGWNYWYAYAILVAAEATAGSIILRLVGSKWQVY
jgi:amino acid transporter